MCGARRGAPTPETTPKSAPTWTTATTRATPGSGATPPTNGSLRNRSRRSLRRGWRHLDRGVLGRFGPGAGQRPRPQVDRHGVGGTDLPGGPHCGANGARRSPQETSGSDALNCAIPAEALPNSSLFPYGVPGVCRERCPPSRAGPSPPPPQ